MRVIIMRGQIIAAGFNPSLFSRLGINAVVYFAAVPCGVVAFMVGFFVADEMFGTDEADVEALGVAFCAGVFFVGGADDEAGGPA